MAQDTKIKIAEPTFEKWEVTSVRKEGKGYSANDYNYTKVKKLAEKQQMHERGAELHNMHSHNSGIRYFKIDEAVYEEPKPVI